MANHFRFNLYDLDLSQRQVEGRRWQGAQDAGDDEANWRDDLSDKNDQQSQTLSGLLNFIDGLWSTSGEERVIVFTTNYKERLDAALLRQGWMDMSCTSTGATAAGTPSFKTLAHKLLRHRRPPDVPGDTAAAHRRGGDAGRGVGDAAARRGRRRRAQGPREVPRGEEASHVWKQVASIDASRTVKFEVQSLIVLVPNSV